MSASWMFEYDENKMHLDVPPNIEEKIGVTESVLHVPSLELSDSPAPPLAEPQSPQLPQHAEKPSTIISLSEPQDVENQQPVPLALPAQFFVSPEAAPRLAKMLQEMGFEQLNMKLALRDEKQVDMVRFKLPSERDPQALVLCTSITRLRKLLEGLEKFAILAVMGPSRTGKSTLLNYILQVLGKTTTVSNVFITSQKKEFACTSGLWLYPETIRLPGCNVPVLLMDGEGLGAFDVATQGREDLYFMRLFVLAFFISQSVLFLKQMQRGFTNNELLELGQLSSHVMDMAKGDETHNNLPPRQILLTRNFPQIFALVAQNWDYLSLEEDNKVWKQVVDPSIAHPAFNKLCGLVVNSSNTSSSRFVFRSLPQCNLPNLIANSHPLFIKKLGEVLTEFGSRMQPKSVVSISGEETAITGRSFIDYLKTVIKMVNGRQPDKDMNAYFESQRDSQRKELLEAICTQVGADFKSAISTACSPYSPSCIRDALTNAKKNADLKINQFLAINVSGLPSDTLHTWCFQSAASVQDYVSDRIAQEFNPILNKNRAEVKQLCESKAVTILNNLFSDNTKLHTAQELESAALGCLRDLTMSFLAYLDQSTEVAPLCVTLATLQLRSIFWPNYNPVMEQETILELLKLLQEKKDKFSKVLLMQQKQAAVTQANFVEILRNNLKNEKLMDMGIDFARLENAEQRPTVLQKFFAQCEVLGNILLEYKKEKELLNAVRSLNIPKETSRILEAKVSRLKVKVLQERLQIKFKGSIPPPEEVLVNWPLQVNEHMKVLQKEVNDCISEGYQRIIRPYMAALDVKTQVTVLSRNELEKVYADSLAAKRETLTWTNIQVSEQSDVLKTVQESFEKIASRCPKEFYEPPMFKSFAASLNSFRSSTESALLETIFRDGLKTFLVPEFADEKSISVNDTNSVWNKVLVCMKSKRLAPWTLLEHVFDAKAEFDSYMQKVTHTGVPSENAVITRLLDQITELAYQIIKYCSELIVYDVVTDSAPLDDPDKWWVESKAFTTKYFVRRQSTKNIPTVFSLIIENCAGGNATQNEISQAILNHDNFVKSITPVNLSFVSLRINSEAGLWRKRLPEHIFKITGSFPWSIFHAKDRNVLVIAMPTSAGVDRLLQLGSGQLVVDSYDINRCPCYKFAGELNVMKEPLSSLWKTMDVLSIAACEGNTLITTLTKLDLECALLKNVKSEECKIETPLSFSVIKSPWDSHSITPDAFTSFESCVAHLEKPWDSKFWSSHFKTLENIVDISLRRNNKSLRGMRVLVGSFTKHALISKSYSLYDAHLCNVLTVDLKDQTYVLLPLSRHHFPVAPVVAPKYTQTLVSVVNMDCIAVSLEMQEREKLKTACLNMANFQHPGDQWHTGACGQEEELFYRTALSIALQDKCYPMSNFECSYAEGVCVLREGAEAGYQFLPPSKGLPRINVLSSAAYDIKDETKFDSNNFAGTRIKVETLFSAAVAHNIEVLVLGAFGCGGAKNPPTSIAAIFNASIHQFAGYFKRIIFCILEESPFRTINIFAKEFGISSASISLDSCECISITAWGTFPIPLTLPGDVRLSEQLSHDNACLCKYAGTCYNPDPSHYVKTAHPPKCPFDPKCPYRSDIHDRLFWHVQECRFHRSCEWNNLDKQHSVRFMHSTSLPDIYTLRKPDELAPKSVPMGTPEVLCKNPRTCFLAFSTNDSSPDKQQHCQKERHFCIFNKQCNQQSNPEHTKLWVHEPDKPVCPTEKSGGSCTQKTDQTHRQQYSHKDLWDFMLPCRNKSCRDMKVPDHCIKFYHHST